jgi:LysR family transcriptional regulator (chromosome initiation inhibitor)
MAAITSVPDAVAGCVVEPLGGMRYRPLAAPGFAARWFAGGPTPAALDRAPMVVFDRADGLQDRYLQRHARRRGGATAARLRPDPPRHHVPASADFHEAVRLGLGWGMLPDQQSAGDLRDGNLVDIDPAGGVTVQLYWQQWRIHSALLGEVAAAIRSAAAATLVRPGRSTRRRPAAPAVRTGRPTPA